MIEAVNSSLSNSVVVRGASVQQSPPAQVAGGNAGAVPSVDTSSVAKAPFISPFISVDPSLNKAVILIRNADTGDVEQQYPSKSRLAELRQQRAREESARNAEATASLGTNASATTQQSSSPSVQNQGSDLVSVQDITSSAPPVNTSTSVPEVAAAALSAGAQSGQSAQSAGVSVLA